MTELRDCAWCGAPMKVVSSRWAWMPAVIAPEGEVIRERQKVRMVSARCWNDHWYGGPMEQVELST